MPASDLIASDLVWTKASGFSPYRVICSAPCPQADAFGHVYLIAREYSRQLARPDSRWMCPWCGSSASWDDAWYEGYVQYQASVEVSSSRAVELPVAIGNQTIDALRRSGYQELADSLQFTDDLCRFCRSVVQGDRLHRCSE